MYIEDGSPTHNIRRFKWSAMDCLASVNFLHNCKTCLMSQFQSQHTIMWSMDYTTCGSVHTNYCGENCEAPHWYLVCCSRFPQLWHVTQTKQKGKKTRRYKSKMLNINKDLPINVLNVRHVTHQNLIALCFCKKPQRSRRSCTGVVSEVRARSGRWDTSLQTPLGYGWGEAIL